MFIKRRASLITIITIITTTIITNTRCRVVGLILTKRLSSTKEDTLPARTELFDLAAAARQTLIAGGQSLVANFAMDAG
jgi:hypothetical protein